MINFSNRPLGRRVPENFSHVEKYPLKAEHLTAPVPVQIGVNWYDEFDNPTQDSDGNYWIAKDGKLSNIRGGHAPCLECGGLNDLDAWWQFYDQGSEGACVGFGASRVMSLLNRELYDPWWMWDMAKAADNDPTTNPGDDNGTFVSAAYDVLRTKGHVPWLNTYAGRTWQQRDKETPVFNDGILSNVWATSAAQVASALQHPLVARYDAVPLLNSWGTSYPHRVLLPLSVLDRLISEQGEAGICVDRVAGPPPPTPTPIALGTPVSYSIGTAKHTGVVLVYVNDNYILVSRDDNRSYQYTLKLSELKVA